MFVVINVGAILIVVAIVFGLCVLARNLANIALCAIPVLVAGIIIYAVVVPTESAIDYFQNRNRHNVFIRKAATYRIGSAEYCSYRNEIARILCISHQEADKLIQDKRN